MLNLDEGQIYAQQDPQGMADLIERFPAQVEDAWRIGREAAVQLDVAGIQNIIIQGMGGSAIGGDLLRALFDKEFKIPVQIVRDYELPRYAGPRTLFVGSSYSGNTEETLAGYNQAKRNGCKILAIATGGLLAARAKADGNPFVTIPGGISPRAALGYSFFPLLAIFGRIGLLPDVSAEVREAIGVLQEGVAKLGRQVPASRNPAKSMAQFLQGQYPLIYAAGTWPGVVAMRWKGQFNENSKNLAFWNAFPELNHNEIVGYEAPSALIKEIRLVSLFTGLEGVRVAKRIQVTAQVIGRAGVQSREVHAEGNSPLARMFSLIQFGDFTSLYLAMLNGIDPTPVKMIDMLKGELAKLDAK